MNSDKNQPEARSKKPTKKTTLLFVGAPTQEERPRGYFRESQALDETDRNALQQSGYMDAMEFLSKLKDIQTQPIQQCPTNHQDISGKPENAKEKTDKST